jgi:hypothetical protein
MGGDLYAYVGVRTHCGEVMSEQDDNYASVSTPADGMDTRRPARRGVLMLGAVAASTVVTIRPALASTTGSVLNCKIPIPDPPHAGQYIDAQGRLVAANTQGAFPPAPRPITGDEAKKMMQGLTPNGLDPDARQAYIKYIQRLQRGTSGFTCYASLQAPRR